MSKTYEIIIINNNTNEKKVMSHAFKNAMSQIIQDEIKSINSSNMDITINIKRKKLFRYY